MALLNHNNRGQSPDIIGNNQMFQQLKGIMGMVQASQNPQMILQQVAMQNPQLASVMQMCSGKNPKDVFYALCQQKGIDPNSILSQLM